MSIASEKIKLATERFLLVRMNPARYIEPTSIGGGIYQITLPFLVNKLQRNGADLTKDSSAPTVNDHWFQNETTKVLQVKLASAPDEDTNVIVAFHYLFYTGTKYRTISEDPEDSATGLREWQPLISQYPSFSQSFTNILQGVFTIGDVEITLINPERDFQEILSDEDSFFNKAVDVWFCIKDETNIKRIFSGTIKKVRLTQNTAVVTCADSFNKLVQPALMGDSQDDAYASLATWPDVDPGKKDLPVPYIVGPFSRYATSVATESISTLKQIYSFLDGNKAIDISYARPPTTSNNRTWLACRQKSTVATQSFGTLDTVLTVGAYKFVKFSTISNAMVGDVLKYVESAVTYYGHIRYVGDFTYLSNPYNCIVETSALTTSSTVANSKSFAITIGDLGGLSHYSCLYDRDFSIDDSTTTTGGNRIIKFTFTNNFEATVGMPGALDSITYDVFYRSTNSSPESHGQILKDFLDKVGIPYSAATFTAADAALVTKAAFSIPNFDEIDYDLYLKYVQDLLGSTLGFLRINADFEAEYYLLETPTSTDVRNADLLLRDSTQCDIEYQDIVTTLIAYNPHNSSEFETSKASTPSETRSSAKSKHLNGLENVSRFRHVLQYMTDRIDAHIGIKSTRFAKYHLETATQDIDTELGDDLQLDNKITLGGSTIQDVKVLSVDKSPGKIALEASDLKGL